MLEKLKLVLALGLLIAILFGCNRMFINPKNTEIDTIKDENLRQELYNELRNETKQDFINEQLF